MDYFDQAKAAIDSLDRSTLGGIITRLAHLKLTGGRLFILGNGGNAADALHATADFRKLTKIEAYTPCGNIAEVTALTNDEGWNSTFARYLLDSHLTPKDLVLVLSVGGGSLTTSRNISEAVLYAHRTGTGIIAITGPDGGVSAEVACSHLRISGNTALVHSLQSLVLHYLFNYSELAG